MALAPLRQVVLGTVAFLVFWILAIFPSFKLLPLGRTAGAVAGAVLTVVFQVETVAEAYAAVDLSILCLLFGTMVVSLYLEQADMFRYLSDLLTWKSRGGRDLLCRICVLAAIASALFTNDTCCLVLTELILQMCQNQKLPPLPYLVALATSSNIGSVATPIGNPQNLVIAVQSGISFGEFVTNLLPPTVIAMVFNIGLLLLAYWNQLEPCYSAAQAPAIEEEDGLQKAAADGVPKLTYAGNGGGQWRRRQMSVVKDASPWTPFHSGILHIPSGFLMRHGNYYLDGYVSDPGYSHRSAAGQAWAKAGEDVRINVSDVGVNVPLLGAPPPPLVIPTADISRFGSFHSSRSGDVYGSRRFGAVCGKWRRRAWKAGVYAVACAMLAAFLYGFDLSWTALTAAVCLMALDFCDAGPNLEKVSYLLLVFFAGMFVTVDGFNSTGIPNTMWDIMEPYARIDNASGVVVLAIVVILLSNIASNVPTVLLLGARVSASATNNNSSVMRAWLILAWASTIAGNLTLVGSAANLIVSEQAMKTHESYGYDLTFFSHIKFGFPSTLLIVALGIPFINC